LNRLPSFGELPGVGLAVGVAVTVILDQAVASEPSEQLGDLPLVDDSGRVCDSTIARAGLRTDRCEHARGAERDPDREVLEWVLDAGGSAAISAAHRRRWSDRVV
jgi:hypothetical protein